VGPRRAPREQSRRSHQLDRLYWVFRPSSRASRKQGPRRGGRDRLADEPAAGLAATVVPWGYPPNRKHCVPVLPMATVVGAPGDDSN
jgi:hypothetical protein